MHPLDHQEDIIKTMAYETQSSVNDKEDQVCSKAIEDRDHIRRLQLLEMELNRNESIKCLQDVLDESQSDTQDFEDEYDSESTEDSTGLFNSARIYLDGRKRARYDQFGRHT